MGGAAEVGDSEAGLALRGGATIVADGGFPNRCRADSALIIYRDAMRQYTAPILAEEYGPDWLVDQVLNKATDRRSVEKRRQLMNTDTPEKDLIDLNEIDLLLKDHAWLFDLPPQAGELKQAYLIRILRNELQHAHRPGDCTSEDAREIAIHCAAILEHFGLLDAAERLHNL